MSHYRGSVPGWYSCWALSLAVALASCGDVVAPTAAGVDSVAVRALVVRLPLGDTLTLTAELRAVGRPYDAPGLLTWSSSDTTVVSVTGSGLLRAGQRAGWAVVRAQAGGHADSVYVGVLLRFASLALHDHACGLTPSGETYCWGYGGPYNALGDGSEAAATPVLSTALPPGTVETPGHLFTCGLRDGEGWCWGYNWLGALGTGAPARKHDGYPIPAPLAGGIHFRQLRAGDYFTCGLALDGTAYCWGDAGGGQLGTLPAELPAASNLCSYPCSIIPLEVPGVRLTTISVGYEHVCGLDGEGQAWCWGNNQRGALGRGTVGDTAGPAPVSGSLRFKRIAAGNESTCGLAVDGTAYCWGWGGPIGMASSGVACPYESLCVPTPMPLATSVRFKEISGTCGLAEDGRVFCWGGSTTAPTELPGGLRFASISAGGSTYCALTASGVAYCWGSGSTGSGLDGRGFPVPVSPPGPLPSLPAGAAP